jgi:energy-coupling factor transporter ATP-binding protein EcfA2
VLVTGPTGSGKSTSLASMIDEINETREEHILTIEDPIEFLHGHKKSLINQREIGSDATSFAAALKAALRQDPDVILVGEMRDLETISTALTAAETGHLVFGTLHTQSAPSTIDRVIDVFAPHQQQQIRVQLSIALQGVMTQTLIPTADGAGRVVACETLVPTPAVRNLIREGKTHQIPSSMQTGSNVGMQTMDAALAALVRQGKISQRVAEHSSSTPDELGASWASAAWGWPREHVRLQGDGLRRRAGVRGGRGREQAGRRRPAQGPQPDRPRHRGQASVGRELKQSRCFSRVKAFRADDHDPADVDDGQLGDDDLRALYVWEAQTENKLLRETIVQVRKDVEAGLPLSDALERHPQALRPAVRGDDAGGGRPAACSTRRCCASPTSSRRPTRCAARSRARWPTRSWSWASRSPS